MAKQSKSLGFSKATISKDEEGIFWITEITKDNSKVYNLTEKLSEWIDEDSISVTIKRDLDIPSEE